MNLRHSFPKFRLPQTYLLLAGTLLGYLWFVIALGSHWLVLIIGGAIALGMISVWFRYLHKTMFKPSENLLDRATFLAHLATFDYQVVSAPMKQAYDWAEATQRFATQIACREPTLIPELLDALHTVLALMRQVVAALQAVDQIQSATYRPLAQQQLQATCDRLAQTHDELQQLQDQILLSGFDLTRSEISLPASLRLVIETNRTVLRSPIDKH